MAGIDVILQKNEMDNMEMMQEQLAALRQAVEDRYGQAINSPTDFAGLCDQLALAQGEQISVSTLKRVWGYVTGYATIRVSTLNILSRYAGCRDWRDFCDTLANPDVSDFPAGDVVVLSTLKVGDNVEVKWSPGRRIVAQYLGQGRMRVIESQRSKLAVGTTFSCNGFVNGEQLILTQVETSSAEQALTYVCGKRGGITARILSVKDPAQDAH